MEHQAARAKFEPETGTWFIDSEDYLQWKEQAGSFLWLHSSAGCGKTILWRVFMISQLQTVFNDSLAQQ